MIDHQDIAEIMRSNEPLLPELCPYVIETSIGNYIRHPFVVMPLVSNAYANMTYNIAKARAEEHPFEIWVYERPFRLKKLIEFWHNSSLNDEQLRDELSWVWPDMEGDDTLDDPFIKHEVLPLFEYLGFTFDCPDSNKPKKPVTIYRGGYPNGIAWTQDLKIAKFFANRFGDTNPIYQAVANPDTILAIFVGRKENEVIVDPRTLNDVCLFEPQRKTKFNTKPDSKSEFVKTMFELQHNRLD